jgi:Protein of unknown function (DUF3300)
MQPPRAPGSRLGAVKRAIRILLGLVISLGALNAHAQRAFNQAELDALLAPIALYPDPLLNQVLDASLYPDDVADAANWSRANPQLRGDAALATVEGTPWPASVKALVAYPEVLARLAESPQWLADLGDAYANYQPYVQATVQQLRARAQASGYLHSDDQQYVYDQGGQILVQPVYPTVVYAPYYNPYVVYGTWWWPAYRPVVFRPFYARPVIVTRIVQPVRVAQPVRVFNRVRVTPYRAVPESQRQPIINSAPPSRFIPEARRAPIVQSAPPARFASEVRHSMPAPQVRASERPSVIRSVQSQVRSGNGGWKHRG